MEAKAMTKDKFIKLCIDCGYCDRQAAENYVRRAKRSEFYDSDFVKAYHSIKQFYGDKIGVRK